MDMVIASLQKKDGHQVVGGGLLRMIVGVVYGQSLNARRLEQAVVGAEEDQT
jgi:hypothetical protein